jgi:catechol 2,3-dioxygenase-like lactoylglutathione lyase family enzyme
MRDRAGPGGRALLLRLDHVYYWVADMERAVAFYRDVLGLTLTRRDGDRWAAFDAGGRTFALHGVSRTPGDAGEPAPPVAGGTAVFEVADLDAARAALLARGATFDQEGDVPGTARFGTLRDPDGNVLQLIEYRRDRSTAADADTGVSGEPGALG